jgi:D-alanyl-D-alanine carboxypeptidase/D-alanyl-D-alanine-endopeptidase (penicillin-binding protein 4)
MKTGAKGSGDNGYIYCGPGQFKATLRGTVPAGVSAFSIKGSIPDPALFSAQYLEKYLKAIRISVSLPAGTISEPVKYDPNKLITETISPPLKDIVYIINKKSDNLYTEQLLKTLGLEKKGEGSTYAGIEVIENFLKSNGISTEGLTLYDGCGLSRTDMITPKMMVQVLTMMTKKKVFDSFYHSLAVAGKADDPGYFTKFGVNSPLENNARIKSGLITGVRSESGYVKDKAGRLIAFSFIANNYTGTSRQVDRLHEKLLIMLAKLN